MKEKFQSQFESLTRHPSLLFSSQKKLIKQRPEGAVGFLKRTCLRQKIKTAAGRQLISGQRNIYTYVWSSSSRGGGVPRRAGFSLLECLLSLSLSLLILISALEVFAQSKRVFNRLKETQETALAAAVALEKIKEDLEIAGAGLFSEPLELNFAPLQTSSSGILMFSKEEELELVSDINPGQTQATIELKSGLSSSLRKGRALYLEDEVKGELTYLTAVSGNILYFSPPSKNSYSVSQGRVLLLEKVEIYLDQKQKIIRRKVNDTSGQPLLEEVSKLEANYDLLSNFIQVKLTTESGGKRNENKLVLYPKNLRKSQ